MNVWVSGWVDSQTDRKAGRADRQGRQAAFYLRHLDARPRQALDDVTAVLELVVA